MIIKQKLWVHFNFQSGEISLSDHDMTNGGKDSFWAKRYFILGTQDIEVDVDYKIPSEIEIRDMKVNAIESQIEKTRADAEITIESLRGDIQKLMCIGVEV
jgi:hypothetical protein